MERNASASCNALPIILAASFGSTVWRLQVSFWRPVSAAPDIPDTDAHTQARKARRGAREPVDPKSLRALTRQPLLPVKPQQPLDIGLFEVRLPENPNIIVPDE